MSLPSICTFTQTFRPSASSILNESFRAASNLLTPKTTLLRYTILSLLAYYLLQAAILAKGIINYKRFGKWVVSPGPRIKLIVP